MNLTTKIVYALAGAAVVALLSACGGGGGDSGSSAPTLQQPPAAAATLAQSPAEAQEAVRATVAGSATVVTQAAGLDSSFLLFGNPLGAGASPANLAGRVVSAVREKPTAVQTIGCAMLFGIAPCSGSITVDTNAPENGAALWPAGTYVAMTFNALSGLLGGSSFSINGAVRIDFLSGFNTNASTFVNTRIQVTSTNVSGSAEGISFGPQSSVALIEFDAAGVGSLTVDGVRITGLAGLTVTDANNFRMTGTRLRRPHWSSATTYIDASFTHWVVAAGRPQAGSAASITAANASFAISVTSSSSTSVVYDVRFTVAGATTRYTVSATYPAGGGAPTYTVQQVG